MSVPSRPSTTGERTTSQANAVSAGVPVRVVSVKDSGRVHTFRNTLMPGSRVWVLGPWGVGTSTLVNLLSGTPSTRLLKQETTAYDRAVVVREADR